MERMKKIHYYGAYWYKKEPVSAAHFYRKPTNMARCFRSKCDHSNHVTRHLDPYKNSARRIMIATTKLKLSNMTAI
jgi:hypothetical protein